jgi:hypothetical protein
VAAPKTSINGSLSDERQAPLSQSDRSDFLPTKPVILEGPGGGNLRKRGHESHEQSRDSEKNGVSVTNDVLRTTVRSECDSLSSSFLQSEELIQRGWGSALRTLRGLSAPRGIEPPRGCASPLPFGWGGRARGSSSRWSVVA